MPRFEVTVRIVVEAADLMRATAFGYDVVLTLKGRPSPMLVSAEVDSVERVKTDDVRVPGRDPSGDFGGER